MYVTNLLISCSPRPPFEACQQLAPSAEMDAEAAQWNSLLQRLKVGFSALQLLGWTFWKPLWKH